MKPAVLPIAALGVAMSAVFLPPILTLSGVVPQPKAPRPMLVVQSEAMPVAPVALNRSASGKAQPVRIQPVRMKAEPVDPKSPIPQFTRVASAGDAVLR